MNKIEKIATRLAAGMLASGSHHANDVPAKAVSMAIKLVEAVPERYASPKQQDK